MRRGTSHQSPAHRAVRCTPLVPLGLGTPLVESLTSYLTRLASLYAVPLWVFYKQIIAPVLTTPWLADTSRCRSLMAVAHKFNGVGAVAADGVQACEAVTLCPQLHVLTMRPWRHIISAMYLLRSREAWCPACYAAWRDCGDPLYSPLLWSLREVRVCPVHRCSLCTTCPACRRSRPMLLEAAHSDGCCPYCRHDLAAPSPTSAGDPTAQGESHVWEHWVAQAVGHMVSAAPALLVLPTRQQMATMLDRCVPALTPSFNALARATDIEPQTLSNWRHETHAAMLGHVCRFCYAVGLSPLEFLAPAPEEPGGLVPGLLVSPEVVATLPRVTPAHPPLNHDAIRLALETTLTEEPPRSLAHVVRDLGCSRTAIRTRFPDLNRAICERYAQFLSVRRQQHEQAKIAEIYRVVSDLVGQNTYPSHGQVARLLSFPLRPPDLVDAWRAAVKGVSWANKTEQDLVREEESDDEDEATGSQEGVRLSPLS